MDGLALAVGGTLGSASPVALRIPVESWPASADGILAGSDAAVRIGTAGAWIARLGHGRSFKDRFENESDGPEKRTDKGDHSP